VVETKWPGELAQKEKADPCLQQASLTRKRRGFGMTGCGVGADQDREGDEIGVVLRRRRRRRKEFNAEFAETQRTLRREKKPKRAAPLQRIGFRQSVGGGAGSGVVAFEEGG